MSIELEPSNQLSFRRPLTEAIKETLIIRNPTQLPIAFKVKTTAPKQYCVRPNSGRVEAGQELEVQVQMQAMREDPPLDFKCKDKFLVQSVAITAEREQLSLQDLWPTIERETKDQIREKKIRCAFLSPLGHESSQINEEEDAAESPTSRTLSSNHSTTSAPASPIQQSTSVAAAMTSSTSRDSADVPALKRELENAQRTIQSLQTTMAQLQSETTTLRQRKPDTGASSSTPMMTAVHLEREQGGYPITYVAGAAVVAFFIAYLFF
ncbi:phosphatidylinositol-binding protein scs2 [Mortierella polycephala]|uniref:Phosphatidylinositol-binding protein scs2 n=1 Tax=Mortierella polycephala TaxID=41804 RepID=A0A9P6QGN3_9FUNG|nr:phosphatidylinositol-binding protein scs2 [Mortierella polycephala]